MSWWQLDSVLKERAQLVDFYRQQPPVACPNDGTPLVSSPDGSRLRCPHDGWQYPDDFDPDTMAGM